jgi:hypothetical protein
MREMDKESSRESARQAGLGKRQLVVRVPHDDFQREVMEKLARLEAMMEMLVGGQQPGRMKMAEDRLFALERNDIRRGVYDRLVSAVIAFVVSALIAMHDHFLR